MGKEKCKKHHFKIFKDPELVGSKYLSFFCSSCLVLVKKKKEYIKEDAKGK